MEILAGQIGECMWLKPCSRVTPSASFQMAPAREWLLLRQANRVCSWVTRFFLASMQPSTLLRVEVQWLECGWLCSCCTSMKSQFAIFCNSKFNFVNAKAFCVLSCTFTFIQFNNLCISKPQRAWNSHTHLALTKTQWQTFANSNNYFSRMWRKTTTWEINVRRYFIRRKRGR